MRALRFSSHGGIENLAIGECPRPRPGPGEVVVSLRAAALNRLDLFVLQGLPGSPVALPHVGGADGAGVIAEVGEGVEGWTPGDEVCFDPGLSCGSCEFCQRGEECLCPRFRILGEHAPGTFAEAVAVPAANLAHRPSHLTWQEAAAMPLTFLTAWRMLVTRAGLVAGESVLIHGIGGGVALAALTLAKALGATVLATSSSEVKRKRASELGADVTFDSTAADLAREIRASTGKRGVDVVVETVGEATWLTSLRAARKGGRIVTCGATSGPNPREEIRLVFWKQLSILGSTMGSLGEWRRLTGFVEEMRLRPVVDSLLPLERGREAYRRLESGEQFGKIVLDPTGGAGEGTDAA